MRNILIIKHGALGDIILASAAFKAIRNAYPAATIHVLTTQAYEPLLMACPHIDAVLVDKKPRPWQLGGIRALKNTLKTCEWDLVIDLQCSTRSSSYARLMPASTKWCGVARGASHRYQHQSGLHAFDNLKAQLALLDITIDSMPDISWLQSDISRFGLPSDYCLLVPGAAPHRPQKRWPYYMEFANEALGAGITPVLIGGPAEEAICQTITEQNNAIISVCGKTSIADIASLAGNARWAVGNDTGPMHVIAASGCPSLVLFSDDSSPERSAPPAAKTLQEDKLTDLAPETVWKAAQTLDTER